MGLPSFNFLGFHYQGATKAATFQHSAPDKPNCAIWLNGVNDAENHQFSENLKTVLFNDFGIGAVAIDAGKLQRELCAELGYCHSDATKNLQRVVEVAKLIMDSGEFTIISGQTASVELRGAARQRLAPNYLVDVFIQAPDASCAPSNIEHIHQQQTKPLGTSGPATARQPHATEFAIHTPNRGVEHCTAAIVDFLQTNRLV